ncbi:hypothetical protein [Variovorax sp.]|jgi:hypothetical protein|uniref:hypothetical protein n=1 Tax=Variovorax sp. TaxID=1871043 RepID=UPI001222F8D9|nr:hypothetical protein [Variovorax sp.]TAJ62331.1 MAG: hypothetical protein EPO53_18220 [Variovorax sp.]
MNSLSLSRRGSWSGGWQQWLSGAAVAFLLILSSAGTWAAPGAHGPNGEHLDTPTAAAGSASTAPRMEARSESFELVAHLRGDELSMLINRFETNEPVLKAQVEVESGTAKATAKFHEDMGDYAVDDPAFLKALKAPGPHPLVVTILAGEESDLLEGTLQTGPATTASGDDHGHAHDGAGHSDGHGISNVVWVVLVMLLLAAASAWRTRRSRKAQGGAQ